MFRLAIIALALAVSQTLAESDSESLLWRQGVSLIPYPQEVLPGGEDFYFAPKVSIVLDQGADEQDRFYAQELATRLAEDWQVKVSSGQPAGGKSIILTRNGAPEKVGNQGYLLETAGDRITVRANTGQGLYYGVQTLLGIIQESSLGPCVRGARIVDWPDIALRAVHYDCKHFQEKRDYVENFIRTLSRYKINMLIWEWEDKFAYTSHPEIGAPGAFTPAEVREITAFARRYHIQIVPLIQGLGHVSYILKWPQYKDLREIASSNWQFCPLKEGVYSLMFNLWDEAIAATPGSEYIHIGTDETWELGQGTSCGCREKAKEIGRYGLMQVFIRRSFEHLSKMGRKVMSWGGDYQPRQKIKPPQGLITFGLGLENDKISRDAGYPVFLYDPNPGIEHLFLPYFYRLSEDNQEVPGCLEASYKAVSTGALSGIYDGMVATSWNCSGVHNQGWMLRYIVAAEYSWSGKAPSFAEFREKYFKNYYGPRAVDMPELFLLLSQGSYFYMESFERRVWHWGEVGKTNLPDLPRDDIEYDPFWNTRYKDRVEKSQEILPKMERALNICRTNQALGVKNSYDFELFTCLAELFSHTARTYFTLSRLEEAIGQAHQEHFASHEAAYQAMEHGAKVIEESLSERAALFAKIKATWEKTQFPKGMSTPEKKYLHARDRQHNFANRRPDLSFMIYDEEKLGIEDYLVKLKKYMEWYKEKYLK